MGKSLSRCGPQPPVPPFCPLPAPWQQVGTSWEQSEALYNLVQEVLLDVLATNPEVLPQPPGVTDGSLAKPGYPGEVWSSSAAVPFGGANLSPPQVNFAVLPNTLPAGDWDLQVELIVPFLGAGSPQAAALWFPTPLYPGMASDGMVYMPNIPQTTSPYPPAGFAGQPMVLVSPTLSVNINQARGIVFNFAVWGTLSFPNGTATATGFARRVR